MNPFVVRATEGYRLYYSGGDAEGRQRICMATSAPGAPGEFVRHGVILDVGAPGSFDAHWCVLPCVRRFGPTWHLYYSGHEGTDLGLQSFPGIGLAVSDDGIHFSRHSCEPTITGDQTAEFPDNRGVAGGGTILEDASADESHRYRMYYTLAVGRKDADVRVDQEKHCAVCHSSDGIHWHDHRLILGPRRDVANEDIAVAAPVVWRDGELYRMLYCGIGTRWGYYSISEAVSEDGYRWCRGDGDENLSLVPDPASPWESQMVEYPSVIEESDGLRLFYCGNGYGKTGIGMAFAADADPIPTCS
ncbi:MAG: hypothetical protein HN742_29435 [Lentisphaerae bacterium]|nr:hypothetical protein [Lentisphaerota bacterium]MBT4814869.1 hypothetical protein [Lentisphaerota bacterium]MBT5609020.1 hypothetical protein [Lentisphaerota bacterium]MBT7055452.1 hypothetical protein [Lentisphaerota bacterium]MBT7846031.1 hypothetical protein [Lentisphaerota bacterium]